MHEKNKKDFKLGCLAFYENKERKKRGTANDLLKVFEA